MSAQDLGKRLLTEVEEVGLDEILATLRLQRDVVEEHFGLSQLDSMLTSVYRFKPSATKQLPPFIELTSLNATGGKTHLLYHLSALAILPSTLGGKQACVVLIDTDGRFSVPRFVQQLRLVASSHLDSTEENPSTLDNAVAEALKHMHLFHPQSFSSTLATLQSLPAYLYDQSRHHSFQRPLQFIALDSASAFHWQIRAEAEDTIPGSFTDPKPGYAQLAAMLRTASKTFLSPIIWTSWHLAPMKNPKYPGPTSTRSYKPSLPSPMQALVDLRLIVDKVMVRKLPAEITVEEARREAESRQKVVEEGKFECFVNEWAMDEKVLQTLDRAVNGFKFRITDEGLRIATQEVDE